MAGDEDVIESGSEKGEIECYQCKRKVVDSVKCYKCFDVFHPKCMEKSANLKSSTCKHEEGNIYKLAKEYSELQNEKDIMNVEIHYLKQLLKEVQEKNRILMENNSLLMEKVKIQGEIIDKKNFNSFVVKDVNKDKKITHNIEQKSQVAINEVCNMKPTYAEKSTSRSLELLSSRPTLTAQKSTRERVNEEITEHRDYTQQDNNEWVKISRNKKKIKTKSNIICTGVNKTSNSLIKGAMKRKWIYVGRIQGKDTSEQSIKDYLCDIINNEEIEVKKLNTQGKNSAFSVGVHTEELFNSICSPDNWPEGVLVREFSFRNLFRKSET